MCIHICVYTYVRVLFYLELCQNVYVHACMCVCTYGTPSVDAGRNQWRHHQYNHLLTTQLVSWTVQSVCPLDTPVVVGSKGMLHKPYLHFIIRWARLSYIHYGPLWPAHRPNESLATTLQSTRRSPACGLQGLWVDDQWSSTTEAQLQRPAVDSLWCRRSNIAVLAAGPTLLPTHGFHCCPADARA